LSTFYYFTFIAVDEPTKLLYAYVPLGRWWYWGLIFIEYPTKNKGTRAPCASLSLRLCLCVDALSHN